MKKFEFEIPENKDQFEKDVEREAIRSVETYHQKFWPSYGKRDKQQLVPDIALEIIREENKITNEHMIDRIIMSIVGKVLSNKTDPFLKKDDMANIAKPLSSMDAFDKWQKGGE